MTPTPQPRRLGLVAGLMTLLLAASLSACSDDSGPDPIPEADDPTSSTTDTSTPEPTEPSWEDDYTDKQLAAYEQALDRWTEFEAKSEPIYAAGKATPAAKRLFQEYYTSPVWDILYTQLETYEQVEVKKEGRPTVLWSRAKTISKSASAVVIEQCADYTSVTTTQFGDVVKTAKRFKKPLIREISVSKPEDSWLIYQSNPPPEKGFKHCTEEDQS